MLDSIDSEGNHFCAAFDVESISLRVYKIIKEIETADKKLGRLFPTNCNCRHLPVINNIVQAAVLKIYLGQLQQIYFRLRTDETLTKKERGELSYNIKVSYTKWQGRLPYEDREDFSIVHYDLAQCRQ